jgi:hypothetical protein
MKPMVKAAALAFLVALTSFPPVWAGEWTHVVEVERPPRKGKPQKPARAQLWVPEGVGTLRGLVVAGKILLERRICTDPAIRKACAGKGLGILYYEPHLAAIFDYAKGDCEERFLDSLAKLAKESGRPEIATVPWLTIGHSTGGIFCRNVAYWKPERVLGIVHVKSGNFQDHIQDAGRTLAGVPLLAVNGEFEEYGPAGGDLKGGLRARYSLHPDDKAKRNQTQWVMIRMQMIERRRRNPENLMSLVVHRDGGHRDWSEALSALTARFIRSAADARLPKEAPAGGAVVTCRPLRAADGWLTDADIKSPRHTPAAYADYAGDKVLAFWHLDRAMAEAVEAYHRGKWEDGDPTEGEGDDKRYKPPEALTDRVDAGGR